MNVRERAKAGLEIASSDRPALEKPVVNVVYNAYNTDGGLLDAPISSLSATEKGILVGHSSKSPEENLVDPVRMLTPQGWEVCNSRIHIQGSVGAVFENSGHIFVGIEESQGSFQAVSVFSRGEWTHYPQIPAGSHPGIQADRVYDFTDNGKETVAATNQGLSVYHEDDEYKWRPVQWFGPKVIHAVEVKADKRAAWAGSSDNIEVYPDAKIALSAPLALEEVTDIKESPDHKQVWVGARDGLAFWDPHARLWGLVSLPDKAGPVSAIEFLNGTPVVATLEGTYYWTGDRFKKIDPEPASALAIGKGPYNNQLFIATGAGRLIQMDPSEFDKSL